MPTLRIPNALQRTGPAVARPDSDALPLGPPPHFAAATAEWGVVAYWPADWLTVELSAAGGPLGFAGTAARLTDVLRRCGAADQPAGREFGQPGWQTANRFRAGTVSRAGGRLTLVATADTNAGGYVKDAKAAAGGALTVVVRVWFGAFAAGEPSPHTEVIDVHLDPFGPAPAAAGYFALDLGNSGSTLAYLPGGGGVRLVGVVGNVGRADPDRADVPSDLRVDKLRSWAAAGTPFPALRQFPDPAQPRDADLASVEYVVGPAAAAGASRGLVAGCKRLAADRAGGWVGGIRAVLRLVEQDAAGKPSNATEGPVDVELDRKTPLRLLAARLLHHAREAVKSYPAALAVTYPTTYSRYEIQELLRAVQTGWLRMHNWQPGEPPDDPSIAALARRVHDAAKEPFAADPVADRPLVRKALDEASASAFFHLHRAIFGRLDGGLAGFRFLYEHGLNLLLCDCGGGTTDIALVRATVPADDLLQTLTVDVIGRSGVRGFGGDDLTRAVARLLKVKLAVAAGKARKLPWADLKPADVERYLADLDPHAETVLQTRRQGDHWPDDRRARALDLWRLAEDLKHRLAADPPTAPAGKPVPDTHAVGLPTAVSPAGEAELAWGRGTPLADIVYPATETADKPLVTELLALKVSRAEVAALVGPLVDRVVRNCNGLIRAKLATLAPAERDVHWVVASGNAMKYPLLLDRLRAGLEVPFLDAVGDGPAPVYRRFEFDPADAKGATAKGAVLALAAQEAEGLIRVDFKGDLDKRLPYAVGYRDFTSDLTRPLFADGERYDDLAARTKAAPVVVKRTAADGPPPRQFVLRRAFPGDDRPEDFLQFDFPDGLSGDVRVAYDPESGFEFVASDATGPAARTLDLTDRGVYTPPSLRGDL